MDYPSLLKYFQLAVSVLLIAVILLQSKGLGLSGLFGAGGGFYRSRRGLEKTIFILTIFLSFLFIAVSFLNLFVP